MQSLSIPTISPKGSTSEVVKRLKVNVPSCLNEGTALSCLLPQALHLELAAFEQGQVDTESLATVKSDLINHSFLLHKVCCQVAVNAFSSGQLRDQYSLQDRTVKAYVACCLADLLKLYAPDAPYSEQELQVCLPRMNTLSRQQPTSSG